MPFPLEYNALALFYQGNIALIHAAMERHADAHAAWEAVRHECRIDPAREWDRLLRRDIRLVMRGDAGYPPLLAETRQAPHGLYIRGSFAYDPPALAIVGTRRATNEGLRIAKMFAHDAAAAGVAVISGLALGIDASAHRGALDAQARPTTAVLPGGLDRVYPASHGSLAEDIVRGGGALMSEYPLGTPSFPSHFLERNRIVAGLAPATLVVEAPLRSGALVTARIAAEESRDVLVVPGPITHPNYAGAHELVKQGAGLVTSPQDIFDALGLEHAGPASAPGRTRPAPDLADLSPAERAVLEAIRMNGRPIALDDIGRLVHLEVHDAHRAVALLAVRGMISETDGLYTA